MKPNKVKKFDELSKDLDEKELEIDIEKVENGEYEIESILDVFQDPKDIPVKENIIGVPSDLSKGEVKRGDTIYLTAMIKKKGSSFSSPATQAVLRLRVIDIYHGLSYLNKVLNK
jgi:hypothetical protein